MRRYVILANETSRNSRRATIVRADIRTHQEQATHAFLRQRVPSTSTLASQEQMPKSDSFLNANFRLPIASPDGLRITTRPLRRHSSTRVHLRMSISARWASLVL